MAAEERRELRAWPPHATTLAADPGCQPVVALDALGWRVVELRPSLIDGEVALWRVTAERVDLDASLHMTAVDPGVALAEITGAGSHAPRHQRACEVGHARLGGADAVGIGGQPSVSIKDAKLIDQMNFAILTTVLAATKLALFTYSMIYEHQEAGCRPSSIG